MFMHMNVYDMLQEMNIKYLVLVRFKLIWCLKGFSCPTKACGKPHHLKIKTNELVMDKQK